eukprot:8479727-Prorocentrum_lima.AAC.1
MQQATSSRAVGCHLARGTQAAYIGCSCRSDIHTQSGRTAEPGRRTKRDGEWTCGREQASLLDG